MITSDVKRGAYEAPTSVTLELLAEGVLCGSEFGENGAAGANGSFSVVDGDF